MNISKALKQKNRLTTQIQDIGKRIKKFNRYRVDNVDPKEDVGRLFTTYSELMEELVKLRAEIAVASLPIQKDLARLNALQGQKAFLESLDTSGEPETIRTSYGDESKLINVSLQVTTMEKNDRLSKIQKEINDLQDSIDVFNATTQVKTA